MDKSEYIKQRSLIKGKIKNLENNLKDLESEYILKNRKFRKGDAVRITKHRSGKIEHGFVDSNYIDSGCDIFPSLVKCKVDGTPSMHKLIYHKFKDTVEIK